jgi:uncharacterized SAM-binding protein YcdF (DUF218 family)
MAFPEPYDLLVILAGSKPERHPVAVELMRRGWARYVAVTGEHERIDVVPDVEGKTLPPLTSTTTYTDVTAIRDAVDRLSLASVLVLTGSYHLPRTRLVVGKVFAESDVAIDVIAWEQISGPAGLPPRTKSTLIFHVAEFIKMLYYMARRRV